MIESDRRMIGKSSFSNSIFSLQVNKKKQQKMMKKNFYSMI